MNSLISSPGAGFEAPFEMLHACHERVHQRLRTLERLAEHLPRHGADEQARQAAADLLRYFDIAAPHHHEDEERHVLPRLRALGHAELAGRIAADHLQMGAAWATLRAQLQALQAGTAPDTATWPAFVSLYRAHIELEEGQAFPLSAAACGAADLATMGEEMAGRRRVVR